MTPYVTVIHLGKILSSELYTDQGEGIRDQLKSIAKQLNDTMHFHTLGHQ